MRGFVISRTTVSQVSDPARLHDAALAAGEPGGRISEILSLSASPGAHARLEAGTATGRLLRRP